MKRMYVTSLNQSGGTSDLWMNVIVFVPRIPCLRPCANRLNSFAAKMFQASLHFGCCRRAQYSRRSPVLWLRTGLVASHLQPAMRSAMLSVVCGVVCLALTWLAMLSTRGRGLMASLSKVTGGDATISPSVGDSMSGNGGMSTL